MLIRSKSCRNLYKRHAFLRSDDEKEYFVHYLLTLNALDYTCFTTSYVLTVLPYRVTIFPTRKHHSQTTQSNLWVTVSGTLAHTDKPLHIPKPSFEIVFKVTRNRIHCCKVLPYVKRCLALIRSVDDNIRSCN